MPFVEVVTRTPLPTGTKAALAEALSTIMLQIEIGGPTEAAKNLDWVWFHVLPQDDWAVGGRLDDTYLHGRTMCFARIIAPEAFLNTELKLRAIAEVTRTIREAIVDDPADDGTGIWVHIDEVPQGQWGSAGRVSPLPKLIEAMDGTVSDERRAEIQRHFDGQDAMRAAFDIPR